MKKVAVICTLYGPNGGTGRVTTEILERYAADGNEVHVFCAEHDEAFAQSSQVKRIVDLPVTGIGILRQLHFLVKASLAVKKKRYDIVYTTGDYYHSPDIVTVHTLKKRGRKVIESLEKKGILSRTVRGIKEAARKIYCPLLFEIGEQLVYYRKNCRYIGVSRGVSEEFCREFRQSYGTNVTSILNGVDAQKNRFDPSAREEIRKAENIPDDARVLLFVGSDWNRKRLEVAIDVCQRFADMHLIVAGHDDPTKYKQLAKKKGCLDRVHFIGFVKNIERVYSAADYFLFTSVYETFGLVALEAMAAGMVVISNRLNGVCEFIESGVNGFLTEDESPEAFAKALAYVTEHPEEEMRIRNKAVEKAKELSWEKCYQQYKQIFDSYERKPI